MQPVAERSDPGSSSEVLEGHFSRLKVVEGLLKSKVACSPPLQSILISQLAPCLGNDASRIVDSVQAKTVRSKSTWISYTGYPYQDILCSPILAGTVPIPIRAGIALGRTNALGRWKSYESIPIPCSPGHFHSKLPEQSRPIGLRAAGSALGGPSLLKRGESVSLSPKLLDAVAVEGTINQSINIPTFFS